MRRALLREQIGEGEDDDEHVFGHACQTGLVLALQCDRERGKVFAGAFHSGVEAPRAAVAQRVLSPR
jgi:hypothetical protein